MSRKKSREYAFRMVFEKFFHDSDEFFELSNDDIVLDDTDKLFVNELVGGINDHYDEIISVISQNVIGYELDKVFKIDLAILIVAVYELKFAQSSTDVGIVINEAVALSKKYSTDKSSKFINGVLAKVVE